VGDDVNGTALGDFPLEVCLTNPAMGALAIADFHTYRMRRTGDDARAAFAHNAAARVNREEPR
jgi:hypothetical protein